MNFVSQLWQEVMKNGQVFIVAEDEFPFIEPSSDEQCPDYAMLLTFLTAEGAADYQKHITELHDLRPSQLKVMPVTLDDLWAIIPELEMFCTEELDTKLRVELLDATEGQNVLAHDTIYVQAETSN